METISSLLVIWLMSAAALGVGSSTLAIASFIVALKDGSIDVSERRMLGVIYKALRVAMAMLALSLLWLHIGYADTINGAVFLWILLFMLTFNSVLMTKHWISFKIGPAFQAATWYTFGFMLTIGAFDILPLTYTTFLSLYLADIILAVLVVNGLLWLSRSKTKKSA